MAQARFLRVLSDSAESLSKNSFGPLSVIGALPARAASVPTVDQAHLLAQRLHGIAQTSDRTRELHAVAEAAIEDKRRRDPRFVNYQGLRQLATIADEHLDGPTERCLLLSKGRQYASVAAGDECVITEALSARLSASHVTELLAYVETLRLGIKDINALRLTGREVVAILDALVTLNEQCPGWGITRSQHARTRGELEGVARRPIEEIDVPLEDVDLQALIRDLDTVPEYGSRIKLNAIHFAAKGRQRSLGDGTDGLDQLLESVIAEETPTKPIRVTFVSFGSPWHYALWTNLAIESLSGDLKGEFGDGVSTQLMRAATLESIDSVVHELAEDPPDILGLSVELGTQTLIDRFAELYDRVFQGRTRPLLVAGNQVPTYFPQKFVGHEGLKDIIVCRHDGELAMRGLIEHVRGRRALEDIHGLVYRDPDTGAVRETPLTDVNPDALIHPSSGETVRVGITNMVQAGRGCIFSCSYCTQHQRGWRPFPLARVLENVEIFVAKGISEIEFCDDEFFGGRSAKALKRVNDFAVGMQRIAAKYQTELTFRIFTTPLIIARRIENENVRVQNRNVRETLRNLMDAGMVRVYIGLESGSKDQKDRYDRRETIEDTEDALTVLRDLNIDIDVGFIMFDPHLTLAEMLDNVRYFRDNDLVRHNTWPFRPLVVNEGTPIKVRLEKEGLLTGKQEPEFLAFEYRFVNSDVSAINDAVQEIAVETASVFYTLKSLSKQHWRGHETATTKFAREATERNAYIYLDLMERLGEAALCRDWSSEKRIRDETRAALLDLVNEIEDKLNQGWFDESAADRESLRKILSDFRRDHRGHYEQASRRLRRDKGLTGAIVSAGGGSAPVISVLGERQR